MTYQSENVLIHFTSAKNADLILGTSTINFGSLGHSNDLSESPGLRDLSPLIGDISAYGLHIPALVGIAESGGLK